MTTTITVAHDFYDANKLTARGMGKRITRTLTYGATRRRHEVAQELAWKIGGPCAYALKASDAAASSRFELSDVDGRFSVDLEHTGHSEPRYVARYQGRWIGHASTYADAAAMARTKRAELTAPDASTRRAFAILLERQIERLKGE